MDTIKPAHEVARVTQQELEAVTDREGVDRQMCVPACFYMLGEAAGYNPGTLADFANSLDWEKDYEPGKIWMRPELSRTMRQHGMSVVTWRPDLNTDPNIDAMTAAGYLGSQREIAFYRDNIVGKTPEQIVRAGWPIIASMKPEFATAKAVHAVILAEWTDDYVHVIDPDRENQQDHYDPSRVLEYMRPGGACTLVLPSENS